MTNTNYQSAVHRIESIDSVDKLERLERSLETLYKLCLFTSTEIRAIDGLVMDKYVELEGN